MSTGSVVTRVDALMSCVHTHKRVRAKFVPNALPCFVHSEVLDCETQRKQTASPVAAAVGLKNHGTLLPNVEGLRPILNDTRTWPLKPFL